MSYWNDSYEPIEYEREYLADSEDGVCGEEATPDYDAINSAVMRAIYEENHVRDYVDGDDTDDDDDSIDSSDADDFDGNMPCDTYGPAACTSACPRYFTNCGK